MTTSEDNEGRESDAWEKHRVEQMLHFRSLPLRQKMQAIEELGVIARRLQKIKSPDTQSNGPTQNEN
jgi:hypothetical protein